MSEPMELSGVGQVPIQRDSLPMSDTAQNTLSDNSTNVITDTPWSNIGTGPGREARPPIVYPEGASKTARRKLRRKLHNQQRDLNDVLSSGGTNQSPQTVVRTGHTNTPHGGRSSGGHSRSVQDRLHVNGPPDDHRSSKRPRVRDLDSSETRTGAKRHDAKSTHEVRPGTSFAKTVVDFYLVMAVIIQPAEGLMVPCSRDNIALIFSALNELILKISQKANRTCRFSTKLTSNREQQESFVLTAKHDAGWK